ncbi:MAG TPA: hypothetical protein VFZ65_09370 [Planctomycetota bacterium]|nr:hypothetical protein [Planctomycetota bacterium]
MRSRIRLLLVFPALSFAACGGGAGTFTPGLGEIMTMQQMRHAKLWFAGRAANWELAAYETDELEEGFADAMHFHATHKSSPVPLTQAIPTYVDAPVRELRASIDGKDAGRFEHAFDALTAGCNGCHLATQFGFNVVVRPAANTFANQDFAVPGR